MTPVPVPKTPDRAAETLEQRFRRLEALWRAETYVLSSYTQITSHPAFREIIGQGEAVVPLMLRDLQEQPGLWVWALPEIVGENPVAPQDAGNIVKMSQVWLQWGRAKGYQW